MSLVAGQWILYDFKQTHLGIMNLAFSPKVMPSVEAEPRIPSSQPVHVKPGAVAMNLHTLDDTTNANVGVEGSTAGRRVESGNISFFPPKKLDSVC
jgi:hypothetical protein